MSVKRERICDCCLQPIEEQKWYRARYQGYSENAGTFDSGWFSMRQHICINCWAAIAVVSEELRADREAQT